MNPPTPRQLRYAVLHHTGVPEPHFDLLLELEAGQALATWRLPEWPVTRAAYATALPDHRTVYLGYQGEVSGGRGEVRRVAGGTFSYDRAGDAIVVRLPNATLWLRRIEDATWEVRAE